MARKPKSVTLFGMKRRGLEAARFSHRGKKCYIWSGQWTQYWGTESCGYTPYLPGKAPPDHKVAGVYSWQEALDATWHCGREKKIKFVFIYEEEAIMESTPPNLVQRPWGTYEVLRDEADFKSKLIIVKPGQQLSYQYHHFREEHWIIVSGYGEFTLNGIDHAVSPGQHVFVPKLAKHRISNAGTEDLRFIEVQLGESFEEEDIYRISDDYGRCKE